MPSRLTLPSIQRHHTPGIAADESLLDKYLESGELSDEEIRRGLRVRALRISHQRPPQ
jgi:hypothetical protein